MWIFKVNVILLFFLGGGRAGALEWMVNSENEYQKGRAIPLCELFKGRVTNLFQNFLMRFFVMLLYILLTD